MKTIDQIYQARRDFQARELEKRRNSLYKSYPELEELDRAISLKNLERSKNELFGEDKNQSESLEVQLYELMKKRERYYEDHKIDETETKLRYFCDRCKDRGYLESDGMSKCSCMLSVQEGLRMGQAHLSNRIAKENFETFELGIFDNTQKYEVLEGLLRTERENILDIKCAAEGFVRDFDKEDTKGLFFYGDVGLGKSFMCSSIAKALAEKGRSVLYLTMNEFVDMMQLYHFDRELFFSRYSMEDYFALERCDLLVLDDLGAELTNSFVKTILFNLINARMINGKKMVISTNLSPDEVSDRYEERVASRLIGFMDFYKFFGENKRW